MIKWASRLNSQLEPHNIRIIFTDGEEQLVYENGEFYVVSTTSSLRKKKKKFVKILKKDSFAKVLIKNIFFAKILAEQTYSYIEKAL